jgi:VWFA-related protein
MNKLPIILSTLIALSFFGCNNCDDCEGPVYNYKMQLHDIQENAAQRQVNLLFQVLEGEGRGVANLTEEDFVVLENGEPVDTEANKTIDPQSIPSRISTVLLLDVSSSVSGFIDELKGASMALIDQKLPNQTFAVYAFDKELRLVQDFTTNTTLLKNQIASISEENLESSTNLYGAIIEVTNESLFEWENTYSIDFIEEHNLVVFTDGRHNANPDITLDQALTSVGNKKVYVAALQGPDLREDPLKQLATEGYFLATNVPQVEENFKKVQDRIVNLSNSLYYLYYTSPISDPTPRDNTLEVRIKNNRTGEENKILTQFNSGGFE